MHLCRRHSGQTWWGLFINVAVFLTQTVNAQHSWGFHPSEICTFVLKSDVAPPWYPTHIRYCTKLWKRTLRKIILAYSQDVCNTITGKNCYLKTFKTFFLLEKCKFGFAIYRDTRWKCLWQWHTSCTSGSTVWRWSLLEC